MADTNTGQAATRAEDSAVKIMERLLNFEPNGLPVLSLYLDARQNEVGAQNHLVFARKRLSELGNDYEPHSLEKESYEADAERILKYLEKDVDPSANGIAVFACNGAQLFQTGQFAAPFKRNQVFAFERPHLYPLARLIDQYRRYAVVLADTNRAVIYVFGARRAVDQTELENVKTKQSQAGGWSQSRYQRHIENYHQQHAKEVIDNLEKVVRDEDIETVILAGDEATIIPLLREQMSKELEAKVVDVLSLGIDTPEHELLEQTLGVYRRHDSLTDQEKVKRLMNEYSADDLGVGGVPETLAALSNGQVEELLISAQSSDLKFDEAEVRKVLKLYEVDGELPETIDERFVADELVKRANQLSAARVSFIEDASILNRIGGVGALLRYRISAEQAAPYESAGGAATAKALSVTQAREGNQGGQNV